MSGETIRRIDYDLRHPVSPYRVMTHASLSANRRHGHITKQRADQIIRKAAHQARLQRNVHAHLFRHGYAINFLNCGGRLDALQEQLGHRDINTTRIYLRLSDEDVKREVGKISS